MQPLSLSHDEVLEIVREVIAPDLATRSLPSALSLSRSSKAMRAAVARAFDEMLSLAGALTDAWTALLGRAIETHLSPAALSLRLDPAALERALTGLRGLAAHSDNRAPLLRLGVLMPLCHQLNFAIHPATGEPLSDARQRADDVLHTLERMDPTDPVDRSTRLDVQLARHSCWLKYGDFKQRDQNLIMMRAIFRNLRQYSESLPVLRFHRTTDAIEALLMTVAEPPSVGLLHSQYIHLRKSALQTLECVCSLNSELAAAVACFGWRSNGVDRVGRSVLLEAVAPANGDETWNTSFAAGALRGIAASSSDEARFLVNRSGIAIFLTMAFRPGLSVRSTEIRRNSAQVLAAMAAAVPASFISSVVLAGATRIRTGAVQHLVELINRNEPGVHAAMLGSHSHNWAATPPPSWESALVISSAAAEALYRIASVTDPLYSRDYGFAILNAGAAGPLARLFKYHDDARARGFAVGLLHMLGSLVPDGAMGAGESGEYRPALPPRRLVLSKIVQEGVIANIATTIRNGDVDVGDAAAAATLVRDAIIQAAHDRQYIRVRYRPGAIQTSRMPYTEARIVNVHPDGFVDVAYLVHNTVGVHVDYKFVAPPLSIWLPCLPLLADESALPSVVRIL